MLCSSSFGGCSPHDQNIPQRWIVNDFLVFTKQIVIFQPRIFLLQNRATMDRPAIDHGSCPDNHGCGRYKSATKTDPRYR